MSKNNGNGKTLTRELALDINSKLMEMIENQAKTTGAIQSLSKDIKIQADNYNALKEDYDGHIKAHEQDPSGLLLKPIVKKLGWGKSLKILAGAAALLILLSAVLMFIIDKLGLGKTLGLFK